MARPISMVSTALLTVAASTILPHYISPGSDHTFMIASAVPAISTGLPGPSSGPSAGGTAIAPGGLPSPAPSPANGASVLGGAGSGLNGSSLNGGPGPSTLISQHGNSAVSLQVKPESHLGYVWLRNESNVAQTVTGDLVSLQDRCGIPLRLPLPLPLPSPNLHKGIDFKPYEVMAVRLEVPFLGKGKTPGTDVYAPNPQPCGQQPDSLDRIMLPASGWYQIRWRPTAADDPCKPTAKNPCKKVGDLVTLVPIYLLEPRPQDNRAMRRIFFGSLICAGAVVGSVVLLLVISKVCLFNRMGGTTWSFGQSWGTNVTIGAGLLGSLLALFAFPDHPSFMEKGSYNALQILFTALVTLAPLVYGLIRSDIQAAANGQATIDAQGYVIMFLLAGALVLCGAIGQVVTAGFLVEEFTRSGQLQRSVGNSLEVIAGSLCVLLVIYGLRSLCDTAKRQSADSKTATGIQPERQIQVGLPATPDAPTPMAQWPLL